MQESPPLFTGKLPGAVAPSTLAIAIVDGPLCQLVAHICQSCLLDVEDIATFLEPQ